MGFYCGVADDSIVAEKNAASGDNQDINIPLQHQDLVTPQAASYTGEQNLLSAFVVSNTIIIFFYLPIISTYSSHPECLKPMVH